MSFLHMQRPREAILPENVAKQFQSLPMHQTSRIQLCPMLSQRKMALDPAIHLLPSLWSMFRPASWIFRPVLEYVASQSISLQLSPRNCAPLSNNMPSISIANDLLQRTGAVVSDVLWLARVQQALLPRHIPMRMSISLTKSLLTLLVRQ